ncbi:hypothetical protein [Paenibacillus sp. XY044]|uniref:hypothetical protein n=1 Tax=Paenibacillus sp. XY044 TaxID=2026089 RepID=UPI000B992449|nr:hypothetical protein [Paenibacillus sp. XY044]OZB94146.1 hypothetical protein CJP46_18205 [Paenibacillus sp. XY044]
MDFNPEIIKVTSELVNHVGKKSVEAIFDKIRAVKKKGNQEEVINSLEEIINELISDKNQLIQITQVYEEQLITQKLSDKDIDYITNSIVPLLESLLQQSDNEDAEKLRQNIDIFKPILSKETFNILQILGFNFKQAIGEPLTKLIESLISSKIPPTGEKAIDLQMLNEQKQVEYLKVVQDEEYYQRLLRIYGQQ